MAAPELEILHEEGPLLIVAKPSGLLTQAPRGIDSLEIRVKAFLQDRERRSGNLYLAVLHRLDRPVSGAVAFARNVRAARRIAAQFEARTVHKAYWALVTGQVPVAEGRWCDMLRKVPDEARGEVVEADHPDAKQAALYFRRLAVREETTWLEIVLETGRYHQIRVQAAARNLPVVGDETYGAPNPFGDLVADPRKRPIALHARRLELLHPTTGETVAVTAPLPPLWHRTVPEWFPTE